MSTPDVRQHLAAYADGDLSPELRGTVEAAVARDPVLRGEVERWQALRRCAQRALNSEPLPSDLVERIQAGLLTQAPRPALTSGTRAYRLGLAGLSAAAVVLLAFVLWPRGAAAMPIEVDGVARIYRACALDQPHDAFHVAGSSATVAGEKVRAAAGFACRLPDFTKCGNYRLDGACACSPAPGLRAVHACYRSPDAPGRIISLFALERKIELCSSGSPCPRCTCGQRGYCRGRDNDVTLVAWNQGGRGYVLAGRVSEAELVRMADGARP